MSPSTSEVLKYGLFKGRRTTVIVRRLVFRRRDGDTPLFGNKFFVYLTFVWNRFLQEAFSILNA